MTLPTYPVPPPLLSSPCPSLPSKTPRLRSNSRLGGSTGQPTVGVHLRYVHSMAYVRVQAGIPHTYIHTNHPPQDEQRVVNHIGGTEKRKNNNSWPTLLYSPSFSFSLYVRIRHLPHQAKYMALLLLPGAYLALLQKEAGLPYRIWQRTRGGIVIGRVTACDADYLLYLPAREILAWRYVHHVLRTSPVLQLLSHAGDYYDLQLAGWLADLDLCMYVIIYLCPRTIIIQQKHRARAVSSSIIYETCSNRQA